MQLSGDLSPLAGLTSLQALHLSGYWLYDLAPLASLTSLRSLDLRGPPKIRKFAPLEPLLPKLEYLYL
jgi:hypothetical protein